MNPARDVALLRKARDVIAAGDTTGRHEQTAWIELRGVLHQPETRVTTAELAAFALVPVPDVPLDPELPICQTVGCLAGWLVVLGAPEGTRINMSENEVYLPGIPDWEAARTVLDYAAELADFDDLLTTWMFAGYRGVDELLTALDYIIENPAAETRAILAHMDFDVADELLGRISGRDQFGG